MCKLLELPHTLMVTGWRGDSVGSLSVKAYKMAPKEDIFFKGSASWN